MLYVRIIVWVNLWKRPIQFHFKSILNLINLCFSLQRIQGQRSDFSLNQTLLISLLNARQIWMTQLILAVSLSGFIFLVLVCMVSKFMLRKDFFLHRTFLWETLQILNYVLNWPYFTQCLTSFSLIDHLLCLYACFFILFHLT